MNYKTLETDFTKNGFRLRQIRREGDVAIYHKVALQGNVHPVTYDVGFETIVVSRHDGYEIGGVKVEPAETYPSSEQWGQKGWTYKTLLEADNKYETLLSRNPEPGVVEEDVVVPVARVVSQPNLTLVIPEGEFTTAMFGQANNLPVPGKGYTELMALKAAGKVVEVCKRKLTEGKGRASTIFSKAA